VSKWGGDYFLSPRAFLSIIGESLVLDYDFAVARSISLSKRKKPFSLFGREWAQRLITSTAICSFNQKFSGFVCFSLQIICAQSSARPFNSLGESSELRKCLFRKLFLDPSVESVDQLNHVESFPMCKLPILVFDQVLLGQNSSQSFTF